MPILASVEPNALTVDPGGSASVNVRVRNRGDIVDGFQISIVGPSAAWASIEPPMLRLFPDEEGVATVTFRVPRASTPAADVYPFGVRIRAVSDPASTTVEEGRIGVNPFVEFGAEVVPSTSEGRLGGEHEITVANGGNAVLELSIRAQDPDRKVAFSISPDRLGVAPGASKVIKVSARLRRQRWVGPPKRYPFSVNLVESAGAQRTLQAAVEQQAIFPTWARSVGGIVVAAILLVALVPRLFGGSNTSSTEGSPGASPTQAIPTVAVTPSPIVTPSPQPTPTEAPSPTILPTPTIAPPTTAPTPDITNPTVAGLTAQVRTLFSCGGETKSRIDVVATDAGGIASVTLLYIRPLSLTGQPQALPMTSDGNGKYSATIDAAGWPTGDVTYSVLAVDTSNNQTTVANDDSNSIQVTNGC